MDSMNIIQKDTSQIVYRSTLSFFCQTYKSNIITIHDMNLLTLATEVSKTKGNSSAEFLLSNLDMVFA